MVSQSGSVGHSRVTVVSTHSYTRDEVTALSPKDKGDQTVGQWSKVLFFGESKSCISFGNQGPRSLEAERRCSESKLPEVRCRVSTVGDGLFYQVKGQRSAYQQILEHSMLALANQLYKDTNTWLKDHGVAVFDWPTNTSD